MPATIATEGGVRLERWRPDLATGLSVAFADSEPSLRAWMPSAAAEQEDAPAFVAACIDAFDRGRSFAYALLAADDGDVVGYANVTPVSAVATFGYWVRADRRGRGFARWAVGALSKAAFAAFPDVVQVEAEVDEGNTASRRVLERAGFSLTDRRVRPARTAAQSDVELVYALPRALS
jgi:RimJ/RimL family protein N-acetyltransferase